LEQIIIYGIVFLFCGSIIYIYIRKLKQASKKVEAKIELAKQDGLFEPVSLHPVIDLNVCIKSEACITACPEKDILGIVNGQATLINASNCVGHGACFHACPVEAISLVIGTEKRGVDLPHITEEYETNIPGIYIAGELGGMGLIKNSVEQGEAAVENIARKGIRKSSAPYDLIIVGAGPAGISAALTAKKHHLKFQIFEQDTLGGTVFTFPRSKIVMTAPMNIPLHGKVKLFDTSKTELLTLWREVLSKNEIVIKENTKVEAIIPGEDYFKVTTAQGETFESTNVLLAIGRRGSPRKLGILGEDTEKVAYRLLEPEHIQHKNVVVVGGGDSAVEAALSLAEENTVKLSYRKDKFSRIKPKNRDKLNEAIERKTLEVIYNSEVTRIDPDRILMTVETEGEERTIPNDLVFIFAGGELPSQFLQNAGVQISKRFGYTMKKH
jgi:thioredoxin reductase/Pyruvate/2-oxoacid:ferredoxin oxidoreductase delta subunit